MLDSNVTASLKEDKIKLLVKSNGDAEEAADLATDLQYDFSGSKYALSNGRRYLPIHVSAY